MKNILQEIKEIITGLAGHDPLYFSDAVEIKVSPHTYPFMAWAVCASPANDLYIMDGNEQWSELEITDQNAALVIGSLYQRLKLMRVRYAEAS